MAFLCETLERRVIPNWRSLRDTISNGELEYPQFENHVAFDLMEYEQDWNDNHSLLYASELVNAAVANGINDNFNAKNAAEYIVTCEGKTTDAQKTVAMSLLGSHNNEVVLKSDHEIDELLMNTKDIYAKIGYYKSLIRKYPFNPINYVEAARFYVMIGQSRQAVEMMDIALALDSENRFVSRSAARLFVHVEDLDRAHYVLRKNEQVAFDPWLIASEISVNLLRDRSSSLIKNGIALINSGDFSPFSLTELTSSLGTLEFIKGTQKKSKLFFNKSLISPNDNSLAQAEWAKSNKLTLNFNREVCNKVNLSYEANALYAYQDNRFEDALKASIRWLNDMPYSKNPVFVGANIAYTFLKDYKTAAKILQRGLEANPNEPAFLNNLAYTYALDGKLNEANEIIHRINKVSDIDEKTHICLTATRGLIAYREKRIEEGRTLYLEAIKAANNIVEDPTYNWNAILNFIREEILATNIIPSDVDTVLAQIHETPKDKGVKALKQNILKLISKGRTASFNR